MQMVLSYFFKSLRMYLLKFLVTIYAGGVVVSALLWKLIFDRVAIATVVLTGDF